MSDVVRGYGGKDEEDVQLNENFKNVVIVDGLPIVDAKKMLKLGAVIKRVFGKFGPIAENGFLMASKEDGSGEGFGFIEYETAEGAAKAIKEGDGKNLDNKHKFKVNLWDDMEKFNIVPAEYEPPAKVEYESKANLTSWLMDEAGRDQFVVRFGTDTHVYFNDPHRKSNNMGRELHNGGEREKQRGKSWTEQYVAWSTRGSYLATFHRPGIALWGGAEFEKLGRFAHPDVNFIDFSPSDKYLVTSNGQERKSNSDPHCIQVFDIRSGKLLRGFDKGKTKGGWPSFKWSHDDRFIARCGEDCISVYQVPTMGLLDKKSFKVQNVQECLWSPTQNVLAYWVPEKDNIPARVALLEIPSRKMLREKHLYSVQDVKLHWQDSGDYLCVKLARKKTKKTIIHNFEIFRLRQKNIPVEVLEIEDNIVAFAWEPVGSRFAIIHGNPARPNVSIYELGPKKLKKMVTLENRPANCLYWSPTGDHLVVAGLGDKNGWLEFMNMQDLGNTVQTEHHMCTDVEWDPSGRFVITSVTQPLNVKPFDFRVTMENGYILWSGVGLQLAKVPVDPCYQVLWRPRPKPLFNEKQLDEIKESLKDKYWKKFEEEDNEIKQSQLSGVAKEKADWKSQWKAFRAAAEERHEEERAEREELRNGVMSDNEDDYVEIDHINEEEISVTTTDIAS